MVELFEEIDETKQIVDCISRDNTRNAYIEECHKWMLELEFSILFWRN